MLEHLYWALAIFVLLLAGAALGVALRRRLPAHLVDDSAKDVVRLGMGLLATIAALVISLLINSSYALYEAQRNDLNTLAADAIHLDGLLRLYGDEARPAREFLRPSLARTVEHLWSGANLDHFRESSTAGEQAYLVILNLKPQNDVQATLKAQAIHLTTMFAQSRLRLFERADPDQPMSLLVALTVWMVSLFVSYCLFSPLRRTSAVAVVFVALSVAAAMFLILELTQPFSGLIQLSDRPLSTALPPLPAVR